MSGRRFFLPLVFNKKEQFGQQGRFKLRLKDRNEDLEGQGVVGDGRDPAQLNVP
jgi:hypothetical protein